METKRLIIKEHNFKTYTNRVRSSFVIKDDEDVLVAESFLKDYANKYLREGWTLKRIIHVRHYEFVKSDERLHLYMFEDNSIKTVE